MNRAPLVEKVAASIDPELLDLVPVLANGTGGLRGDLAQFETAEQEARLWRAAVVFSISQQAREFVFAPANDRDRERRRLRKAYGTVEDIRAATLTEPQQARRVQVEALVQAAEKRLEVVADFDTLASTWASLRAEDDQGAPGAAH